MPSSAMCDGAPGRAGQGPSASRHHLTGEIDAGSTGADEDNAGEDGTGRFPTGLLARVPAESGFAIVLSDSFDNLTPERLASLAALASAFALTGLAALLAHTVSRRWLERSDTAYAPFIAAVAVMTLAWLASACIRLLGADESVGMMARWLAPVLGLAILLLWYRSATASVWRALRGNPRGVWLLGMSIRTATGRAVGYAFLATLTAGAILAFEPLLPLGFQVTVTAALTLAVWVGPLASLVTGPVLAAAFLFLPFQAGTAIVGMGVILLLALAGMLKSTDGELA